MERILKEREEVDRYIYNPQRTIEDVEVEVVATLAMTFKLATLLLLPTIYYSIFYALHLA